MVARAVDAALPEGVGATGETVEAINKCCAGEQVQKTSEIYAIVSKTTDQILYTTLNYNPSSLDEIVIPINGRPGWKSHRARKASASH